MPNQEAFKVRFREWFIIGDTHGSLAFLGHFKDWTTAYFIEDFMEGFEYTSKVQAQEALDELLKSTPRRWVRVTRENGDITRIDPFELKVWAVSRTDELKHSADSLSND